MPNQSGYPSPNGGTYARGGYASPPGIYNRPSWLKGYPVRGWGEEQGAYGTFGPEGLAPGDFWSHRRGRVYHPGHERSRDYPRQTPITPGFMGGVMHGPLWNSSAHSSYRRDNWNPPRTPLNRWEHGLTREEADWLDRTPSPMTPGALGGWTRGPTWAPSPRDPMAHGLGSTNSSAWGTYGRPQSNNRAFYDQMDPRIRSQKGYSGWYTPGQPGSGWPPPEGPLPSFDWRVDDHDQWRETNFGLSHDNRYNRDPTGENRADPRGMNFS